MAKAHDSSTDDMDKAAQVAALAVERLESEQRRRRQTCGEGVMALRSAIDVVDHPTHYTSHPSGVECITVTEHMTFNAGNAVKYLWRAGLKDAAQNITDLKKARWYVDREIQRLTAATQLSARERGLKKP